MRAHCNLTVWRQRIREYGRRVDLAGMGLFASTLVVYILTLAPSVLPSDHGEFQFKLYTMELIHPPGYPLYLLAGKTWLSLVPFGSVAYRTNLFSAVCAAAAVWFLYKFMRLSVQAKIPAVVGAGLLAFSPLFWNYAITAGTYSLNALLFTALLYLWLSAYDRRRSLLWVAFVFGLGLAHHRLIVVSAPAFLLATLFARRRVLPHIRVWSLFVPVLLLPLSLYGLVAWQGAWPLPNLLRHVLISGGAMYRVRGLDKVLERLTQTVWPWLCQEFGWPPTLLGIGALIALLWLPLSARNSTRQTRQRYLALLLIGLLLSHLAFYSLVRVEPDEPRYFVPVYALVATGVGIAVACVQTGLRRWLKSADRIMIIALVLPVLMAYRHFPKMAECYDDYFERLAREAFQTVEQDAVIIASWSYAMPLRYYQAVEGWRPDVRVLVPDQGVDRDRAVEWIDAGHPVYFREGTFGLDWPESGYTWIDMNVGGLYRALPEAPDVEQRIPGGDVPPLQAVGLSAWPLQPDTLVALRTIWEAGQVQKDGAELSVRLVDSHQQTWGRWTAALSRLRVEQTANKSLQVDLFFVTPPTILPGEYMLELHLSQDDTLLTSISLPGVPVRARSQPLAPQRLLVSDWVTGREVSPYGLRLIAVTWPGRRFSENTVISLSLFWQAGYEIPPSTISLYLSSAQQRWPLLERKPVLESLTGEHLPAGTLLESRHTLAFARVPPGHYHAELEVSTEAGRHTYDLGRIEVEARRRVYQVPFISHPLRSVLGGEIELLGYDLEPRLNQPDAEVVLMLYWRPLIQPTGDYKVFTHLMDAQGNLVDQRDDLPLGGTVLTSQWSAREVLTDQYIITIPSDLADGVYQLEVGMYRPDSGERLPAVDAEGNRWLHDKVVLQQLEIPQ